MSNPTPIIKATHPQVYPGHGEIIIRNSELDHDVMILTPDQAIAIGFAMFTLALQMKEST